jgi:uncharacterized protein DUF222
VAQYPFLGPGHDGDQPSPGVPARDGVDEVGERYLDWFGAEIEADRIEAPPEEEPSPGVTVSLGEAGDTDLDELARMANGLAGTGFAKYEAADVMPPGPVLGALTAQAVEGVALLPDDKLVSVIQAARRQQARAEYEELAAVAEFARRRERQFEASKEHGDKPRHREGEFAAEELGMDLNCSYYAAGKRMELAEALSSRLPATFAGMAVGTIDGHKAKIIAEFTQYLSDEQAAQADQILAAAAPEMASAELKKKAARLEYKLDPDGVRQRKEEAARKHRRVEARQEASGNAALSGRELAVEDALTAKNSVWAEAAALCNAGLDVPLREARTMVYLDRLRGLNPWDRLTPLYDPPGGYDDPSPDSDDGDHGSDEPDNSGVPADADDSTDPGDHGNDGRDDAPRGSDDTGRFPDDGYGDDESQDEDEDEDDSEDNGDDGDNGDDSGPGGGPSGTPGPPGGPAGKAPLPALINITVSDGTLLGWSGAPAEVAGFGLTGPGDARDLIAAASRHPRTRWCVTVLGKDGEATAHGCASGQHPWTPPGGTRDGPGNPRDGTARAGPDGHQRAQLAALLRQLGITPAPIAKGTCDHARRENRYRPGRKLSHLIRARTATCSAPGCNAQAIHNELDHTVPYPDGPTDQCNLTPLCARHHHAKHAPGWKLQQPEPGIMRWTLPSGRTHTTRPTRYDE